MRHVLCIDIGTSYLKTALVAENGTIVEKYREPLSVSQTAGYVSMHPEEWLPALAKSLARCNRLDIIQAVSITGNGPSLLAVSHQNTVLSPALSWMDRSAVEEAETITTISGKPYDPSFYLAKALRLLKIFGAHQIWKFFSGPEYLAFLLGAEPVSYLPAPGYEPHIWNRSIHAALGLPENLFPPYAAPGTVIGTTKGNTLHLPAHIPLIAAYPDFLAAIAGTDCIRPGYICDRTGSSETLNVCADQEKDSNGLFKLPHLIPGLWNYSGGVSASGKAIDWFCRIVGKQYCLESFIEDAYQAPFDPNLLFLPYLNGERAPLWNSELRGQFLGLALNHSTADLARAVLEGIIFGLRFTYEKISNAIGASHIVRPSGYLADIPYINQLKADILGLTIETGLIPEGELLGCAVIALKGISLNVSLSDACNAIYTPYSVYDPNNNKKENYDAKFRHFSDALVNAIQSTKDTP